MDGGFLLDNAALGGAGIGLRALGHDVDTLDDGLALLGQDVQDATGLTLVVTSQNIDGVTLLDF